ncbi:MAG TPA: hypothetical protein VFX76_04730 [Roseiflexaceae bacterium]|nr:hypothetical protein [Roseiflexaceae bacterium]
MQRSTPRLAVLLFLAGPLAATGWAQGATKIADCQVDSAGKVAFKGKCSFTSDGSTGSFSLASQTGQGALFGSILVVSVSIIERGVAEVRGLTRDGINSRWGEAKRSTQQPACWVGSDFKVCAW